MQSANQQDNEKKSEFPSIFALELQQTDFARKYAKNTDIEIFTPGGLCLSRLYCCGALTEIIKQRGIIKSARVADPTGVFMFEIGPKQEDVRNILADLTPPVFVSVIASLRPGDRNSSTLFTLVPEYLKVIDRAERDRWIIRTGSLTMDRLENMLKILTKASKDPDMEKIISHYNTTRKQLVFLAKMVERALSQVQSTGEDTELQNKTGETDITEKVLALIKEHSGPRGVSVQELSKHTENLGITESALLDALRKLISEDELYQPSSGSVKIL